MPSILLTNFYDEKSLGVIKELVPDGFKLLSLEEPGREQVLKKAAKADYMIAGGRVCIDGEILDKATQLKMIQRSGVGLDSIDQHELKKRGLPLYVNEGVNARSVAEHTLLLMLSVLRQVVKADSTTKAGKWNKHQLGINNLDLFGKTIGLIGLGQIGEHVARMLSVFGTKVLYNKNSKLSKTSEEELNVSYADLPTLLSASDIISIHCPYNEQTHHLIGYDEFRSMKQGVILVNTARGSIVNEESLVQFLKSGALRGAGLDVFEKEPARDNPLFSLENVIVTPHIAGITEDTFRRIYSDAFKNIVYFHQDKLHMIEEKRVKI